MSKLTQYVGMGSEQLGNEKRNFVNIVQKTSDILDPDHASHIEGVKVGDIYCGALNKLYGQALTVIVLGAQTVYTIEDIQGQYKGMRYQWDNTWAKGVDNRFHTTEGFTVSSSTRFYCVTPEDLKTPLIVAFKGASSNIAKQFQTALRELKVEGQPAPIFAGMWKLSTVKQQNDKGSWHAFAVPECIGLVDDDMVDTLVEGFTSVKQGIEQSIKQSNATPVAALIEDSPSSNADIPF